MNKKINNSEIDVFEFIINLWNNKFKIILITLVFISIALFYQLYQSSLKKPISKINTKTEILPISTDDETVSSAGTIKLLLKQKHHQNKLIIYSNGKVKQPLPKSTKCITSCIPSEQILNFSHVSMHIAPEHPIYGQKKSNNDFVLGALTNQNKSNYTNKLLRLTYNPYYNDLLKKISLFINEPP